MKFCVLIPSPCKRKFRISIRASIHFVENSAEFVLLLRDLAFSSPVLKWKRRIEDFVEQPPVDMFADIGSLLSLVFNAEEKDLSLSVF